MDGPFALDDAPPPGGAKRRVSAPVPKCGHCKTCLNPSMKRPCLTNRTEPPAKRPRGPVAAAAPPPPALEPRSVLEAEEPVAAHGVPFRGVIDPQARPRGWARAWVRQPLVAGGAGKPCWVLRWMPGASPSSRCVVFRVSSLSFLSRSTPQPTRRVTRRWRRQRTAFRRRTCPARARRRARPCPRPSRASLLSPTPLHAQRGRRPSWRRHRRRRQQRRAARGLHLFGTARLTRRRRAGAPPRRRRRSRPWLVPAWAASAVCPSPRRRQRSGRPKRSPRPPSCEKCPPAGCPARSRTV